VLPVLRDNDSSAAAQGRIRPEMASFRALVLEFVRDYLTRWGQSPSYGEVAAKLGTNRTRVKRAVVSLERAGLVLRRPGTRGLSLPDEIARARQLLESAGLLPVTNPTLLPPAALDYPAPLDGSRGQRADGIAHDEPGAGAEGLGAPSPGPGA
jgi:biotin operon repressor